MTQGPNRKDEHIELCLTDRVAFDARANLFDEVTFIHCALPELSLDEIDLGTEFLGKKLRAPILIASMTGGSNKAESLNRRLAAIAERRGYAMGLGSQRPMLTDPASARTFAVRDVAPNVPLVGNIGGVQAAALSTDEVIRLVESVGGDALFVHLNPAQELVQPGGDRDFRGVLPAIERLVKTAPFPIIVKETGCGLSLDVLRRLKAVGVDTVDVSGAGGTSWVGVETLRAKGLQEAIGQRFWNWGIPTVVSLAWAEQIPIRAIATGGVRHGLDVARAFAFAETSLCGFARPVLQALERGGEVEVDRFFDQIEAELRSAMLLVGAKDLAQLSKSPRMIGEDLMRWIHSCFF